MLDYTIYSIDTIRPTLDGSEMDFWRKTGKIQVLKNDDYIFNIYQTMKNYGLFKPWICFNDLTFETFDDKETVVKISEKQTGKQLYQLSPPISAV